VDEECVQTMVEAARPTDPTSYRELLEQPITQAEISNAIRQGGGGRNKEPGRDGIGLEFYKIHWAAIKDDL